MDLTRSLAPIVRRLRGMVSRAVVDRVTDTTKLQTVQTQGLDGEVLDRVERFGEFGFASHPLVGSEAILLSPSGTRALAVVVAVDDRRYRPTDLAEGECCLYTTSGTRVKCKADGKIELGTSPTSYVALATLVNQRFEAIEQWLLAHAHAGVTPGSGTSGVAPGAPVGSSCAASEVKAK
jgi:phage baseplate assembly protein V